MKTSTKAFAALFAATALLSGCGRHSTKETYYMVVSNSALPYWQTAAAGFNRAAAEYKVTAKIVGPGGHDPRAELDALQKAAAAKPAGILISVADASLLQPGIDAAVSAGIPVITIDSDAAASRRLYFIGTNNLEAGRLAGQRVALRLNGHGNIVVYTLVGQPNTEERLKGLKDVLSSSQINFAEIIDVSRDPRIAFDRTQQLLNETGSKKIAGFVCLDSASGKMAADALKRANATDRELVAWDVNQDTLDDIKEGAIDATIAQKPYTMGFAGLKALDEVHHNPPKDIGRDYSVDSFSPYPVFVDTGTSLVDKDNVDIYLASAAQGRK